MHKINFAAKKHAEANPEDKSAVSEVLSAIRPKKISELQQEILQRVLRYKEAIKNSSQKISVMAAHKIRNGSSVLTLGDSQKIIKAIEKAKSAGTNFSVCAIDYRKLPTGRENAQEMLSKAVKESDILFFEPEAVCGDKIIVTEEANAAIEEARKHKVPSYGGYSIFGSSKKPGQKNLREAKASSITGLVSEGGITKPALLGRI